MRYARWKKAIWTTIAGICCCSCAAQAQKATPSDTVLTVKDEWVKIYVLPDTLHCIDSLRIEQYIKVIGQEPYDIQMRKLRLLEKGIREK